MEYPTETITVNGTPLQVVIYQSPLYRGDEEYSGRQRANRHYGTDYHKFFATQESATVTYIKNKEYAYVKKWTPTEPLRLLDMNNLPTRLALNDLLANQEALHTAFPVYNQTVYRFSADGTAKTADVPVLREICGLHADDDTSIDGYYIAYQATPATHINHKYRKAILNSQGQIVYQNTVTKEIRPFHAEVGLCSTAFEKLTILMPDKHIIKYQKGVKSVSKTTRRRSASFSEEGSENERNGGGRRAKRTQKKARKTHRKNRK